MLLRVTTVVILLALFIQYIEGIDRVIVVSESDIHGDLISDDEDILAASDIGNGSGPYVFDSSCCIYGKCSCPSLYNALTNLTSNFLINITTDVVLSSIITLVNLANITITGHNNPTVNCNNSGGLLFISCHNCTIEGIIWDECGARIFGNPSSVLHLFNSSNITITNCTFQHSIGQAVVLSEMIGDVNIDHCNFLSNKQYEGHGTAIHYSSNILLAPQLIFNITNCMFSYNEGAKSVVYFGGQSLTNSLHLQNCKFNHNRAVPIYLSNQNLYISGNVKFYDNVAENGGGMFISDHSNVTFHKSAAVNFRNNNGVAIRTIYNGGVIFLTNHSSIVFDDNSTITFYLNGFNTVETVNNGGVMYIDHYSTITFQGNSTVTFNDNEASNGGVMYIDDNSTITFQGSSTVAFIGNRATNGGVMIITDPFSSFIIFQENSMVTFNDNYAINNGGVMTFNYYYYRHYFYDHYPITFQGNSRVTL